MNRLIITFILFALLVHPARAQESWTLKSCIDYGLKNHGSARVYRNNVAKAKAASIEALSSYLPQIAGTATLDDNLKLQSTVLPAGFGGSTEPTITHLGTQYSTVVGARLDQTIFDQSLLVGLKANKPNTLLAIQNEEQNDQNLIYTIAKYYYQVFVYQKQMTLLADNLKNYEQLSTITRLQFDKGVAKKVDLDRVQVNLNNARSQFDLAEKNHELAKNQLKDAMGFQLGDEFELADSSLLRLDLNRDPATSFDVKRRIDYQIANTNLLLSDINRKTISAKYVPKLTGYAQYNAQALGNEFKSSYNHFYDYSSVGLKLSIPIFDGFQKSAQYKQKSIDYFNAQENLKVNQRSYELEFLNASTQWFKNRNSVLNDEQNMKLAKAVLEDISFQYKRGVVSLSDLLNDDNSYNQAQTTYISSLYNYFLAVLDVEKSKGTIKEFYNNL